MLAAAAAFAAAPDAPGVEAVASPRPLTPPGGLWCGDDCCCCSDSTGDVSILEGSEESSSSSVGRRGPRAIV